MQETAPAHTPFRLSAIKVRCGRSGNSPACSGLKQSGTLILRHTKMALKLVAHVPRSSLLYSPQALETRKTEK